MRYAVVSGAASAAVVAALLVAAAPADAQVRTPEGAVRQPAFDRTVLTADGPRSHVRVDDGRVVVSSGAWGRPDRNRREVFSRPGATASRAQTSCATWVRRSGPAVQEGLAVRIRNDRGRVRAVTLTKNIEFGLHWVFNVLTWDSARAGDPWRTVGQYDLSRVVGRSATKLAPLPWRVCLRATGRAVAFKIWLPERSPEPSWQDRRAARHARLPAGFGAGGVPGWYVGHLPGHGRLVYRGLTTS